MLILTRYTGEQVLIGEAHVTILEVSRRKNGRGHVRLGIEAPAELPIMRTELLQHQNTHPAPSSPSVYKGLEEY